MNPSPQPIDRIDFLPDWYRLHQRRRTWFRWQVITILLLVAVMFKLLLDKSNAYLGLVHTGNSLNIQLSEAHHRVDQVQLLQQRYDNLNRQLQLHRQLSTPINFSQIAGTLSGLMPPALSLRHYQATLEHVGQTPGDPASAQIVTIELRGHAPSRLEIAHFVGCLSGNDLFDNVRLVNSKPGRIGDAVTQDFSIIVEVHLPGNVADTERGEVARVE